MSWLPRKAATTCHRRVFLVLRSEAQRGRGLATALFLVYDQPPSCCVFAGQRDSISSYEGTNPIHEGL